ncbi:hypothetical protein [Anoxybacillus kestanbolensis]|uniref:hypothetical protein n=1 Tax=Anoxybacillus kestanbolensis TaxID=227476 RepID=UPI003D195802
MDETHVRAYQALRTTWAEVGNQKQVPSYGHHDHVSILANSAWHCSLSSSK